MSFKARKPESLTWQSVYYATFMMSPSRSGSWFSALQAAGSDYKQGSSGAIVQLFQSSGISTVKKMWPDPNRPTSQTRRQCSFAQPRSKANWALFSAFQSKNTLNSVQVNRCQSCLLWKMKSTLFFFVFFRMAALDCNRGCCVTAGKNMHDLVKGWIQSHPIHF